MKLWNWKTQFELRRASLLLVVLLTFIAGFDVADAAAQVTTADVLGTVTDQTGAVIPGAKVTLRNLGTGIIKATQSNEAGDYLFTLLTPGHYTVTVEAKGFKKAVFSDLVVVAGDRAREDSKMQTGNVEETVEVTSAPPLLQTDSSAVSSVVTEQAVQDLPLNGRNFIDLVTLQPGVNAGQPSSLGSGGRPDDRSQSSTISANGQSDYFNNQLVDGLDNNDRVPALVGASPSIDAIAEVQVDTNSFSAEIGRAGGAVVNIITKSGTNKYHGSAYEFFRNDIFDANPFGFGAKLSKSEYRQNQFGGSIGGPIKKNKTFFFGDVEDNRIIQGLPATLYTVPTCQEQALGSDCKTPTGVYDFTDNGGSALPAANADPVGKAYLSTYPLPNTGGAGALVNNYVSAPNQPQFTLSADGRIDQSFSNGDQLFGRYTYNNVNTFVPGAFPAVQVGGITIQPGGSVFGFAGASTTKAHGVQFNYIHTFKPNLIMELKAGFTRIAIDSSNLNEGKDVSSEIGLVNANTPAAPQTSGLSPINITSGGYASVGDSPFLPLINTNNNFQYLGSVTYTHGAHTIKTGAQFIRRQLDYFQSSYPLGWTFFAGISGNAIEDLALGEPLGYIRGNALVQPGYRNSEYGLYVQDDWRVTHSLTVNIGLRWDVYEAFNEAHNRYSNFEYPTLTLIQGSQDPHIGINTNYKNFGPRVGFAQSLGKGTVVRGGYGISYYPSVRVFNAADPPYTYANTCIPCDTKLGYPDFTWPILPIPTPSSTTNLSGTLSYTPSNLNTGYVQGFNLTVQKELGANVLTVSGIGELSRHLSFETTINIPPPNGPYPNSATQGPAPAPAFLTAASLPNVSTIAEYAPQATNNYYALQAVFARRLTKGLGFNLNYTLAHGLGDSNLSSAGNALLGLIASDVHYDYGNSDLDIRHRFATTWNYELPFGQNASGAKALLMKGWVSNFIMYWQTGQTFEAVDSATNPNGLAQINLPTVTTDRPNLVQGVKYRSSGGGLSNWLNPAAFTPQPAGTAGDERNDALYGPHTRRADLSLFKNFDIREGVKAQFRAECYNISNTPNFLVPNASISSFNSPSGTPVASGTAPGLQPGDVPTLAGGFGSITSTVPNVNPRQFQFALKVLF